MPKPKKTKGTPISLSAFQGSSLNSSDLPSGPSGMSREDRYGGGGKGYGGDRYGDRGGGGKGYGGDRYGDRGGGGKGYGDRGGGDSRSFRGMDAGQDGGGGDNYVSRDEGPSRSEEADKWRRGGRSTGNRGNMGNRGNSGFDRDRDRGGDRFGDRGGGGDRYGGGGGGDRYGGGGGDRYGGGGGGGDRFGMDGGGGGDSRPAHLRRFGSNQNKSSSQQGQFERPSEIARVKAQDKKEAQQKESERPVIHHDVNRGLDEGLAGKVVVAVADSVSSLETAIKDTQPIEMGDLVSGLNKLSLSTASVQQGLVDVLAKSLVAKTLGLADCLRPMKADVESELISPLVTKVLQATLSKMEELQFTEFVRRSGVDFLPLICGDKTDEEVEKFLTEHGLLCIKPVPDMSDHVIKSLESGESPDTLLAHINKTAGPVSVSALGPVVIKVVVAKILAGDVDAAAKTLEPYKALLFRILSEPEDLNMQKQCVFEAQLAWFEKGATKGVIKKVFIALYETEIISAVAFMEWKEDTNMKKAYKKSKMKALLQANSWLEEIRPVEEEYSDEGDEGDEEEDEYFVNNNLGMAVNNL